MSDRVVYVCGCDKSEWLMSDDCHENQLWGENDTGCRCRFCSQPVRAINIDHLERIKAAAKHVIEACRGEECDILGPIAFDKLIEAVEEGE